MMLSACNSLPVGWKGVELKFVICQTVCAGSFERFAYAHCPCSTSGCVCVCVGVCY
jgi:hypothetical protein